MLVLEDGARFRALTLMPSRSRGWIDGWEGEWTTRLTCPICKYFDTSVNLTSLK